jgi:hypothetical protein
MLFLIAFLKDNVAMIIISWQFNIPSIQMRLQPFLFTFCFHIYWLLYLFIFKSPQHPPLVVDWLEYYLFWFWVIGSTICFCVRSRSIGCLQTRDTFFDDPLMGRAASGSRGKIRWMWTFMFQPSIKDTTFKKQTKHLMHSMHSVQED